MPPAKDDALFGDGTQATTPADSFADPLSGLDAGPRPNGAGEVESIRIAAPVQPDPDVVREMVDAAMREGGDGDPAPRKPPRIAIESPADPPAAPAPATAPEPQPPAVQPGMLPQQRNWPTGPRRSDEAKPLKRAKPQMSSIKLAKPSSGSTGVIVAVALLLLFGVIAFAFLASLVDSIASLFG
ncbi:hypothetical protein [Amycolatopsis anabasis]|uniref:hypothetical protein n=1 Tax=Amycolatopsis anabasis TaxID=1840409 RepID=UPI00131B8A3F|nr:hypothetical protein [Amycolatopsis anabasis]